MTPNVERRRPVPDLSISRVLTGLWQVADMERTAALDLGRTAAAMAHYVDAGFTTFDMADHYGPAEVSPASSGRDRRNSPCSSSPNGSQAGPVSRRRGPAAVDRALTRLDVEAIDLLQFHAWNYADPSWLDALFDLRTSAAKG